MVWTPYVGYDYPNIGGVVNNLQNNIPATLDTNGNGLLEPADDPYGPYYPGDEYVDWVGLANNWAPEAIKARKDIPAGYYEGCMNGNNGFIAAIQTGASQANLDFYGRFANQRKPMILR